MDRPPWCLGRGLKGEWVSGQASGVGEHPGGQGAYRLLEGAWHIGGGSRGPGWGPDPGAASPVGSLVFAGRAEAATVGAQGSVFCRPRLPLWSGGLGHFLPAVPPGLAELPEVTGDVERGGPAPLLPPRPT